jgi:hypothetical protein
VTNARKARRVEVEVEIETVTPIFIFATRAAFGAPPGFAMGEASYGVPAILAVTLVTAYMLHYFAASECDLAVRFMVMVSWTLSLSIVALVPADVAATMYDEETSSLSTLWDLSYWITFTLTWFVLPFHQLYEDAGDFSALARASTSLRENGIFYGVIVFIGLLGAILLTSYGAMTSESMATFALASSTIFGICAGIFALGFGLVDVPKIIWRRADVAKRQAEAHRRLGVASRALEDAFVGLRKVIKASETTREVIPRHHVYASAVAVIVRETPKSPAFEARWTRWWTTSTTSSITTTTSSPTSSPCAGSYDVARGCTGAPPRSTPWRWRTRSRLRRCSTAAPARAGWATGGA